MTGDTGDAWALLVAILLVAVLLAAWLVHVWRYRHVKADYQRIHQLEGELGFHDELWTTRYDDIDKDLP